MSPFTTPPPRLLIRSPSPTTIEYTVTTAPLPPTSRWVRYLLVAIHCMVRFICAFGWTGVVAGKYGWVSGEMVKSGMAQMGVGMKGGSATSDNGKDWRWAMLVGVGLLEDVAWRAVGMKWWKVVIGAVVTVAMLGRRGFTEDSLLVIRNLGIQTRTIPSSTLSFLPPSIIWLFSSPSSPPSPYSFISPPPLLRKLTGSTSGTTRFIPTSQIQDIWIHEGFVGFEVRFYLGVVVKGEEELVVVFPRTRPGRRVLERVWRGARACLFGRGCEAGKGERGEGGEEGEGKGGEERRVKGSVGR